jgi:hypothetical protein
MRLTVGPLPPAVYWRRRAVVFGVLLFVTFLLVYSCADSGAADRSDQDLTTTPTESASLAEVTGSPTTTVTSEPATTAPAQPTGPCSDDEISVTPATEGNKTQLTRGQPITLYLRIKNVGTRTCTRDIGADQQELRITQGAEMLWSSDHCGGARGSVPKSLTPGQQVEGKIMWNGLSSTNCQTRPLPNAGTYQLYGRVGTKTSAPVVLTLS